MMDNMMAYNNSTNKCTCERSIFDSFSKIRPKIMMMMMMMMITMMIMMMVMMTIFMINAW
jgi:hypothetical protein